MKERTAYFEDRTKAFYYGSLKQNKTMFHTFYTEALVPQENYKQIASHKTLS